MSSQYIRGTFHEKVEIVNGKVEVKRIQVDQYGYAKCFVLNGNYNVLGKWTPSEEVKREIENFHKELEEIVWEK